MSIYELTAFMMLPQTQHSYLRTYFTLVLLYPILSLLSLLASLLGHLTLAIALQNYNSFTFKVNEIYI